MLYTNENCFNVIYVVCNIHNLYYARTPYAFGWLYILKYDENLVLDYATYLVPVAYFIVGL